MALILTILLVASATKPKLVNASPAMAVWSLTAVTKHAPNAVRKPTTVKKLMNSEQVTLEQFLD